jgi:SAM-dependent methyltransferase
MTPVIDLFSGHAEQYRNARPGYPACLFEYLANRCESHHYAWDAATGNGQAAIDLTRYFAEVKASDVSQQQINLAMAHENIEYSVQQSEATDYPDQYFDFVCVFQALHWFDHGNFWKEVKRVLKPNGVFAACGYSWLKTDPQIEQVLQTYIHPYIHSYWAPQARLLWDRYEGIDFPFSNIETRVFNTNVQWNLNELFAYITSWSATVYCVKENGDTFLDKAYDAFLHEWGNPEQKKEIQFDFFTISGTNSCL